MLASVRLGAADFLAVVTQPLAGSDPPDASVRVVGVRRSAQLKAATKKISFNAIYRYNVIVTSEPFVTYADEYIRNLDNNTNDVIYTVYIRYIFIENRQKIYLNTNDTEKIHVLMKTHEQLNDSFTK